MYRLTTFEKIGEQYNLPDDVIDRLSDLYIEECLSYDNALKYHTERKKIFINNHYHLHRIKMYLVDCEFKSLLRRYLSYKNLLYDISFYNIIYINQHNEHDAMMEYDALFNLSLDIHIKSGMGDFVKYLKIYCN